MAEGKSEGYNPTTAVSKSPAEEVLPQTAVECIYGYDGNIRNNLFVLSEDKTSSMTRICYTAGNNIIFYELNNIKDSKENKQTYIHGTVGALGISCVHLSPSKR